MTRTGEDEAGEQPAPARGSLLRGAGIALLLQGCGVGLVYLLHVLLARWMGAEEYGTYVYVLAWAGVLAIPAGLGLPTATVRLIAEQVTTSAWPELRGLLRRSWQLTAAAGAGVALIATAAVVAVAPRLDSLLLESFLWGVWLVPLLALLALQAGIGRGIERIVLALAPERVIRPLLLLLLAGWLTIGHGLSAPALIRVSLAALAALVMAQLFAIVRVLPPPARRGPTVDRTRAWLRIGLPMMLTSGFLVLLNQTDVLMVGLLLGPADVGLYNAAVKTATLVGLALVAVNAIAAPRYAAAWRTGGRDALQRVASQAAHLAFWPSLAAALALIAFGGSVLGLFGVSFVAGRWPMVVLILGQLVNAAAGPVGYLLAMTGHQDENARVFALSAALDLALNALLIPAFGLMGAAAATATTMAVWNLWLHTLAVRRLGVRGSVLAVLMPSGVGG